MMKDKNASIAAAMVIATALAINAEGLSAFVYKDIANPKILTVCYGHTGPDVVKNKVYTLKECDDLLDDDMRTAIATVERCHPNLPEKVLAAFADAVYNIGPKVACDSTASTLLAKKDYVGACDQLPRWDKSTVAGVSVRLPGLTKRRAAERAVCLEGAKA